MAWLHGEAVGCGMLLASDLSARTGRMPADFVDRMRRLLERTSLPVVAPALGVERYMSLMRGDKKSEAGEIRFVLIEALGRAGTHAAPDDLVAQVLETHGGA
jgi:3-dehydroquinate synthase